MLNIIPNLRILKYLISTFGILNSEHTSLGKYIDRKTDNL